MPHSHPQRGRGHQWDTGDSRGTLSESKGHCWGHQGDIGDAARVRLDTLGTLQSDFGDAGGCWGQRGELSEHLGDTTTGS